MQSPAAPQTRGRFFSTLDKGFQMKETTTAQNPGPYPRNPALKIAGMAVRAFGKAAVFTACGSARAVKYSWKEPRKAARNFAIAAATGAVILPAALHIGYVEGTTKTYDCTINENDPIQVKPYADQTFKEFWNFPLGYMLGLRDTWINRQIQILTPLPKDGMVSKFILQGMCGRGGEAKQGSTFEITDTWWRSDKKFRSADLAAELGSLKGQNVDLTVTGIRVGNWNWFENVLSYKIKDPVPAP